MIIENNSINIVGDKAISIGENSLGKVLGNNIVNASQAIVVKDGSIVESLNNTLISNNLDYVVFPKKKFFNKALLKVNNTTFSQKYLFSEYSDISINIQNKILTNIIYSNKIKDRLYGNLYGKSSK